MKKIIVLLLTIILFIPNVFATNARTLGELKKELAALKTKKANQEYEKKRTKKLSY